MWNPSRRSRSALALAMAAAVVFVCSTVTWNAGSALAHLTSGARATALPGASMLAAVIVVAATGILLALAGKEVFGKELLGHPVPTRERPRRRR